MRTTIMTPSTTIHNDTNNHNARELHEWARQRTGSCVSCLDVESWSFWLKFIESFISRHPHVAHVVLSDVVDLLLYFNLSFIVFFLSSVLMYPDLHTDLDKPGLPWKITCATPPRGASTPTTSPTPSHLCWSAKQTLPPGALENDGPRLFLLFHFLSRILQSAQLNAVESDPRQNQLFEASNVGSSPVRKGTTRRHQGAKTAPRETLSAARAHSVKGHTTANALTNAASTTHTGKTEEGQLQPNAKPSEDGTEIFWDPPVLF